MIPVGHRDSLLTELRDALERHPEEKRETLLVGFAFAPADLGLVGDHPESFLRFHNRSGGLVHFLFPGYVPLKDREPGPGDCLVGERWCTFDDGAFYGFADWVHVVPLTEIM